jgi:MFS family permease
VLPEPACAAAEGQLSRYFTGGLWRHGDFVKLWSAETVSQFGTQVSLLALPLVAILVLDSSAFAVAVLGTIEFLPFILFALPAGVWVDRLRRKPILVAGDLGRAVLLASVPVAYFADALTIWQLYVVALGAGVLTIFFDVAYQSYLPSLVSRDELIEGNSKLAATASVSEFAGFSISGWLVQVFSGPFAILVDAVSFVVSAGFLRTIRAPEPPRGAVEQRGSAFSEAVDGMRVVVRDPLLRSLAGVTPLASFGIGMFFATYMIFVTRSLGFNPGVLGVIFGLGGISSLFGAVLAGTFARRYGIGVTMIAGIAMMGISMFFIPIAQGATVVAAGLLIAQQIFGDGMYMVFDINATSLRQAIAPQQVLGRITAFNRMLDLGFTLIGILIGGVIGQTVGLRTALCIGAGAMIVAAAWLFVSPVRNVVAAPAREEPFATALDPTLSHPPIV